MTKHYWVLLFATLFSTVASSSPGQTIWDGSEPDDFWFTADNWDTGVAPTGATAQAVVGAPSPTVTNGAVLLQSLSVTSDGVLNVGISQNLNFAPGAATSISNAGAITALNNSDLQALGTVDNSGSITIASTGNQTDLEIAVGGATLTGGGTVTLTGAFAGINDASGTQNLTIADQTIQGVGNLGRNTVDFDNQAGGLILANVDTGVLTLDASTIFTNAGVLRASNGGILDLADAGVGGYANAGGTIESLAGSEVRLLTGARIIGGVLTTAGDGVMTSAISSNIEFDNLSHSGVFVAGNNSDTRIAGTINNTGSITIASTGNQTDLEVAVGGATLTGGGTVTLTGAFAGINDASGTQTLTIANQTIQGNGNVGRNTVDINNTAGNLIHANVDGSILTLDSATVFTNAGVLRASSGGILALADAGAGGYVNTGGTIEALAGSEVQLITGARIIGGLLTTAGDGVMTSAISSNIEFDNLTHSGTFVAGNNSDTRIAGTINNTGSITIASTGNQTDLEIAVGGATLTGGGTVTLTGTFAGIDDASGTQTLTIADQTIQGSGNVGRNTADISNTAGNLIHANAAGSTLTIDTANVFTNAGVLRASGGGVLALAGAGAGGYVNAGGTIEALAGSEVQLVTGARIVGGTLTTTGDGVMTSAVSSNIEFDNLTHSGVFVAGNNSDTRIAGTINNTGSITIASTGNQTDLEIAVGGATLTGGGTVTLTGAFAGINDASGTQTLTIADQTIQGNGNVGRNTANIDNTAAGTILANVTASPLTIDESGTGPFDNDGTLAVANDANLRVTGDLVGSSTAVLAGNGTVTATGGVIDHDGLISPGSSPGELVLDASTVNLGVNAEVFAELGGTTQGVDYDLLDVLGAFTLDGGLELSLLGGFLPSPSDLFEIVTADDLIGEFSNVANGGFLLSGDGLAQFTVNYGPGSAFNEDSVVLSDFVDLSIPEPAAAVLAALSVLPMVGRRQRVV